MPLLDHFRPPLSTQRHWESFHTAWAGAFADFLNERWLPEGYFAEEQVHPSARVEIDVATFEERAHAPAHDQGPSALATASRLWSPPAAAYSIPAVFSESFEFVIFKTEGGPMLVAAIELISPGNKDRPVHRRAFVTKCASYLQQGIGLVTVDVVTTRDANLHDELLTFLAVSPERGPMLGPGLYAAAYRPTRSDSDERIDVWPARLGLGGTLPVLPLHLGGGLHVPLDLDATYSDACRRRRLG